MERGCVPRRRHHPQQPVDIRRSHFLRTLIPSVTLLRLIPLTRMRWRGTQSRSGSRGMRRVKWVSVGCGARWEGRWEVRRV